ncbi:hypothetical protein CN187_09600 [Sinorhizobium meliloti]|nr:hypothetical protein CN187_09600 [Sinorhizobium meliloti]
MHRKRQSATGMSVSAPWGCDVSIRRSGRESCPATASEARMRAAITVAAGRSQKFTGKPAGPVRRFPCDIWKRNLEYIQRVAGRGCILADAVPQGRWGLTSLERTKIRFSGGAVIHTLNGMGISNLAASQFFNGKFASYRLLLGTESPLGGSPPPSMKPGAAIRHSPRPADCSSHRGDRKHNVPDLSVRASRGPNGRAYRPSD